MGITESEIAKEAGKAMRLLKKSLKQYIDIGQASSDTAVKKLLGEGYVLQLSAKYKSTHKCTHCLRHYL
ncbi:hypothetical protein IEQ34_008040 [Dendrobium chrysotoxum]|uniref:Uncharacterized protein n=1 Tax=Dendrobium chrysotoxum TaxID=161865 RepID=A0AAV7H7H4_DENCH|nr:hypothetical protein IEQ34_008040 [Dendrobium chrysotoxum]